MQIDFKASFTPTKFLLFDVFMKWVLYLMAYSDRTCVERDWDQNGSLYIMLNPHTVTYVGT